MQTKRKYGDKLKKVNYKNGLSIILKVNKSSIKLIQNAKATKISSGP